MEGGGGQNSWADQWDHQNNYPDNHHQQGGGHRNKLGGGGGGGGGFTKKVGEGFGKTRAVASSGAKKVKQGTSVGIQWIKDKYHKTTHKH